MRHRLRLASVALVATSLLLAGCGGSDEPKDEPNADPGASETAGEEPAEPAVWPLTGLPLDGDLPKHAVLVTKVNNTRSSSPQVGLGSADLVVEELVEGGMTRLAVFHHSEVPDTIGPVRSMRASDIGIVPEGATVVTSGAAQVTINRINGAGIPWITEGEEGVYRETSRSAPYNLFARLSDIAKRTKATGESDPYLPFGDAADLPKGAKASSLQADFGNHTTAWEFRDGTYVNPGSYAADGDAFPASSVLVLRVKVGDAGYKDPGGYPVPETKFEGKGQALLFHNGRLIRGTWAKDGHRGAITLTGKDGEFTVPAGNTWVELVPEGTGDITWAK